MQYLRRGLWFIARKLLVMTLIISLLVLVFYLCMNLANINILLQEGMKERAAVTLKLKDTENLSLYFTESFLQNDEMLAAVREGTSPYAVYTIRDFDHRAEIEWFWSWPWETTARARIQERVLYIDGELPTDAMTEEQKATGDKFYPPAWPNMRYEVELIRDESAHWKIDRCRLLESVLPEATPSPEDDDRPAETDAAA